MNQWYRRIGLALFVVSVIVLAAGAYQSRSLMWDDATGTVESCTTQTAVRTGKTPRYSQECVVTWVADGVQRRGTVGFTGSLDLTGTQQAILVDGDDAYASGQRYFGPLLLGMGVVFALAGVLLRRAGARTE